MAALQKKVAPESVIVIQGERGSLEDDPTLAGWEERRYGRNVLLIWQKE